MFCRKITLLFAKKASQGVPHGTPWQKLDDSLNEAKNEL